MEKLSHICETADPRQRLEREARLHQLSDDVTHDAQVEAEAKRKGERPTHNDDRHEHNRGYN